MRSLSPGEIFDEPLFKIPERYPFGVSRVPLTPREDPRLDTILEERRKAENDRADQREEEMADVRVYRSLEKPIEVLGGQERILKEHKAMILTQHRMIEEHQAMLMQEQTTIRAQQALIEQQQRIFANLQKEHKASLKAFAKFSAPKQHAPQQQPRNEVRIPTTNQPKLVDQPVPPHVLEHIQEVRDNLQEALVRAENELHQQGGIDKAKMIDLERIKRTLISKVDGAVTARNRVEKDVSIDADLLKKRMEPLETEILRGNLLRMAIDNTRRSRLLELVKEAENSYRVPSPQSAQTDEQGGGVEASAKTLDVRGREIKLESEDDASILPRVPIFANARVELPAKRCGPPQESDSWKRLRYDDV